MIWRLLNKLAEKKLEKMGYEKLDMDGGSFIIRKYIRRVNESVTYIITIYRSDKRFFAKKRKSIFKKIENRYVKHSTNASFNSDEMHQIGTVLKYLDKSLLIY